MKKEPLFFTEKTEIGAQHVPIDSNKFAEGGLIAPNGKPSNLTPKQYKLVRTPEFKAWFGDWESDPENASKVIDENGEPLVVYHGTDAEFTEFKHQKKGWDTFWFTPKMDTAQMYSNTEKNNPVVFECFLNLRNPHNKYPFDTVKYDGFIDYRVEVDYFTFKKIVTIEVVQVVNSNQIKLADGTNTTFDPNNDDIRFKDGGSVAGTYSRFRPSQTTIFNPPLVGLNGNKLISYTWKYTWTVDFNKNKGEEKEKRISDWTQAEQSAETGRDLVHTYTVEKPTGEVITVSSESVPVILGFTNKEQKKVFGNLATASKTLAKQEMQLAILEAQEQEFLNAQKELENQNKPEVSFSKIEDLPFIWKKYYEENPSKKVDKIYFKMGDILQEQYLPYGKEIDISDWEFPEKLNIKPTTNTINNLEESWVSKRLAEKGLKRPYGIIDLKNRINRQKTKVENMLATQKFEKGGLIAPNGKPSNLTTEQYKLVRTPEFKAWFGDWENDPENASKVVDENGEPLIVYHGTSNGKFYEFSKKKMGQNFDVSTLGFYFTNGLEPNRNKGIFYGSTAVEYSRLNPNGTPSILEVFLNVKNPININADGWYSPNNAIDKQKNELTREKQHGYDGVISKAFNTEEFGKEIIVVAFEPNQIKLADGTNTTFDPNNPDIRFKVGGSIDNERVVCENCGWSWKVEDGGDDLYECHKCDHDNTPNSFMKWYIDWYKGISDKMVITMSLPNTIAPFREKNVVILDVFEKKDQNTDAKPYLKKIVEKADEYGVVIYLEPQPRTDSLLEYYERFGFELTPNKQFMKRIPHYAGGGGIDINEPFDVNGKTLAERVRILLKQLYPDYKWSVTSSYNKLDVYLLEADFDPFTDKWREEYPTRDLYYSVDDRDFEKYNRENNPLITDRAVEVFKPIREYLDKFVFNRNAGNSYADGVDYNVYENTYIGKWDKPYKQVEPKAGKKKPKAPVTPTVKTPPKKPPFKVGDILAFSQDKLNRFTGLWAKKSSSEFYFEVTESVSPFEKKLIKYDDLNNTDVIVVETNEILDDYVKATKPLFKTGDTVVKKLFPNNPKKVTHRAFYQQIAVKYSTPEKKFLLSGMYWNYHLENGEYADENELELYNATPSTAPTPTPPTSNSTIIENLEVWNEDLISTWDEATEKVKGLGEGWRLPTKEEFENILYPNKSKIPNLRDIYNYWSSTGVSKTNAWGFDFSGGIVYLGKKENSLNVRAVRDIKQYTTQTPNNVFSIQNIVSKTQWSDGLKKTMIEDFVNSGYENVTPLIGARRIETSKNIENKIDGFASGKNTYLQANTLAEEIHKLLNAGNSPSSPTTPNTENTFIDYLNANTEKANEISKELEVTTSLAMFVMGSKDIANLDSKKYAELMEEFLSKFPKLIEDDSTNAN